MHYNGVNSYLFVNGTEIYKFKAKDSKIVASLLCLGIISKDWSMDMSLTLVQIIMLLIMMILKAFMNI